jgi:hypothetical protein
MAGKQDRSPERLNNDAASAEQANGHKLTLKMAPFDVKYKVFGDLFAGSKRGSSCF